MGSHLSPSAPLIFDSAFFEFKAYTAHVFIKILIKFHLEAHLVLEQLEIVNFIRTVSVDIRCRQENRCQTQVAARYLLFL